MSVSRPAGLSYPCYIALTLFCCKLINAADLKHFKPCDKLDPEVFMSAEQLIKSRGYPVQSYTVQTEDGYLLQLLRISSTTGADWKIPVFLQHGMGGSAIDFFFNFGSQSLGYFLTNENYDVWVGNFRGNIYSRKHIRLNADDDKEFWDFSWDEIAKYDLPAMIDFVLKVTGHTRILYIGHSMGTTTMFALLSTKPEYNSRIKLFIGLAPVAFTGNVQVPIMWFLPFLDQFKTLLSFAGVHEVKPSNAKQFTTSICEMPLSTIMIETTFFIYGSVDPQQFNYTRLPVYLANFPRGYSTNVFFHYAQMAKTKKFQHYDHGKLANQKKYGQETPPEYDLNKVTCPVSLMWGAGDKLSDPQDVKILSESLPNLVEYYRVGFDQWNHLDFIVAIEAFSYVNTHIRELLKSYWK